MSNDEIINQTCDHVKQLLSGEGSGHDWWHVLRVWNNAKHILETERADNLVVELSALLHDISDWKSNGGDETVGAKVAKEWLETLAVDSATIDRVCEIISTSSFKGSGSKSEMKTIEGKILQDADRLDAIGAIGIARGFVFCGSRGLPMYDPNIKPLENMDETQYKNLDRSTYTQINHFYEKLLLLKDLMNTQSAKKIAESRHKFMEEFLERFYGEWEGKK